MVVHNILICLFMSAFQLTPATDDVRINGFELVYQWNYINYTWSSLQQYEAALESGDYIPGNVILTAFKTDKDKIYVAMPQLLDGVPATLGTIQQSEDGQLSTNPLVTPFPSWEANIGENCETLQSVHGIEIDKEGRLWVLDGVRYNGKTDCPPKIVVYDLENGNEEILRYEFTDGYHKTAWFYEIVIDDDFVYISDHSFMDPGLIVFDKDNKRSWKRRDASMFSKLDRPIGKPRFRYSNMAGITLTPKFIDENGTETRLLFYSAFASHDLYSINTKYLKNWEEISLGNWRKGIQYVGKIQNVSKFLLMDTKGRMTYVLPAINAIGIWDFHTHISTAEIFAQYVDFEFPAAMSISHSQKFMMLANNENKLLDHDHVPDLKDIYFRIFSKQIDADQYVLG